VTRSHGNILLYYIVVIIAIASLLFLVLVVVIITIIIMSLVTIIIFHIHDGSAWMQVKVMERLVGDEYERARKEDGRVAAGYNGILTPVGTHMTGDVRAS
jgi:uncharacterized membrane-anchored protein YitT (DUF2179 family)